MNKRKMCLALAIIFALSIASITLIERVEAASYKKGSTGSVVSQIQTTLKNQGFYSGSVDGVFGSATEKAVKSFQSSYGLTVDGKVGSATLKAMGISAGSNSASGSSSGDEALLARLISAEARGDRCNAECENYCQR